MEIMEEAPLAARGVEVVLPEDDIHFRWKLPKKGVYLASLTIDGRLSIWVLDESCGQFKWFKWVLEHQNNLKPLLLGLNRSKQVYGPWILRDINYHLYSQKFPGEWDLYDRNYDPSHFHSPNDEAPAENNFEWHSDDDDIVDNQCNSEERNSEASSACFTFRHPPVTLGKTGVLGDIIGVIAAHSGESPAASAVLAVAYMWRCFAGILFSLLHLRWGRRRHAELLLPAQERAARR
uniref:Uncharacterized protein n=1 Tax=Oryza rufipogon TaxID=4529 RepID=A0A0E0NZ06_ORYRU